MGLLHEWVRALKARPGRRGRPDRDYAAIAALYVNELGSGTEVRDLARQLNCSPSQVRNFLYEARNRRLLTEAPEGRAGGSLTPKAVELLDEQGDQ